MEDKTQILESDSSSSNTEAHELPKPSHWQTAKRLGRLFAVKPVLIIYGLQWAITGPVTR